MEVLKEAKALYELGFAVHFIKPNSKAPVKSGWSGPIRDNWEDLERDYRPQWGLGVRLGEASKLIGGGYLANIDVDIKSTDKRHHTEALAVLNEKFGEVFSIAPIVKTGNGFRLLIKTSTPIASGRIARSAETTTVMLPGSEANKRQLSYVKAGKLTADQLKAGWRVRPAWEIEVMSTGKQVVLPPSIHPESGRAYTWQRDLITDADIPLVKIDPGDVVRAPGLQAGKKLLKDFVAIDVDLVSFKLPSHIIAMIETGTGTDDRSAALLICAIEMVKAGMSDVEILSVLTDPGLFLGQVAYDHAVTASRSVAASWVKRYTLEKARTEADMSRAFAAEAGLVPILDPAGAEAQAAELITTTGGLAGVVGDNRKKMILGKLRRNKDGKILSNLENVLTILQCTYGPSLFRRDLFAERTIFGQKVPWGPEIGSEVTDTEALLMIEWFINEYRITPSKDIALDATEILAQKDKFHPVKEYLLPLRWDGIPRVGTWLKDYLNVKDCGGKYLSEISMKFLIGLINRVMEPGCQLDYMLVLQSSEQGKKKSSAFETLVTPKWFSSTALDVNDKDSVSKMQGKWLIEFGELSTINKDVKALKNFITTRVDRVRPSYGRRARDFPRQCAFGGSSNQGKNDMLMDTTGNRRFWVVSVGDTDIKGIEEVRDQLFAEALNLFDLGERPYLTPEAEAEARIEQDQWAVIEDVYVEKVEEALEKNAAGGESCYAPFPTDRFSLSDILKAVGGKDDGYTQRRVTRALHALGYGSKPTKVGGKVKKRWHKIN